MDELDGFDPQDLIDMAAQLRQAEVEETVTVCSYVELPYESAMALINASDRYLRGDVAAVGVLLDFVVAFAENTKLCMRQEGVLPE